MSADRKELALAAIDAGQWLMKLVNDAGAVFYLLRGGVCVSAEGEVLGAGHPALAGFTQNVVMIPCISPTPPRDDAERTFH